MCIDLFETELTNEDPNDSEDSARRLNYALNTIAVLGIKNITLLKAFNFKDLILIAVESLKDKPWITTQVCKILNLLDRKIIISEFLDHLKIIVLEEDYNTYSFQTYQIWLLLAKHKCVSADLKEYAIKQIEKNDQTNRAVIAAMVIYMCSVDKDYRRVVLRKHGEEFAKGYFQNRMALISLRAFSPDFINQEFIDSTLKYAHEFTHKYKNKDLVFVLGAEEEDEDSESFEQLYSI
jgi:hypothetical protein